MDQPRPRGRLPKSRRILRRSEYLAVQSGSKRVVTPHFVMLIQARSANRDGAARLGVTASRKVGNAVLRNRAKRLVREAFRATRELWPDGTDVVVIVRGLDRAQRLDDVTAEWLARANEIRRRAHQLRAGQARDSEG